jgi:hypothetical protein
MLRCALIALLSFSAAPELRAMDGAAIVYGLDAQSESAFQQLLNTQGVRYICDQQIVSKAGVPELARRRVEALAKAGKRVVLQIWWGPGGEFPWTKYSFANIALDDDVRADFFREVVDPCIDQFGPSNLYGVHLMEETGMQFGTDVAGHEDPNDLTLTKPPPGTSYDAPFWNGFGKLPGGVWMANVRRHEKDFTRLTGLRFADAARWGELGDHLLARWTATRLQSGGQVEFARHIHAKYPGLKAFTWDILQTGGENPRTDYHLEGRYFDGVICDVYGTPNYNFEFQRAYRLLCPRAEIIQFSMGGMGQERGYPYASEDQRRGLTVGAYLAGVDVAGFFEKPPDFTQPERWQANAQIFRTMNRVPAFRKKSAVLLISDSVSDVYSCTYAWTGLKYFDFLPTWEAYDADLDDYRVVILHASGRVRDATIFWDAEGMRKKYGFPGYLDYRAFDHFVERGGALIISGEMPLGTECPFFLAREKYLRATPDPPKALSLVVRPEGWLKDEIGLSRPYRFAVRRLQMDVGGNGVVSSDAGYFIPHGKGWVFLFPFNRPYDPKEPSDSPEWQDYRQLLRDVARGLLKRESALMTSYFADPKIGNAYLAATSDDSRWSGTVIFDFDQMTLRKWRVPGVDLFSGENPIVLSKGRTAVVAAH